MISIKRVKMATNHSGRLRTQKASQMSGPQRHNNAKEKRLRESGSSFLLLLLWPAFSLKNDLEGTHRPDANDDFEVVLQGPLDVLLEVELGAGRQMVLQRSKQCKQRPSPCQQHKRLSESPQSILTMGRCMLLIYVDEPLPHGQVIHLGHGREELPEERHLQRGRGSVQRA